MTLTVVLAVGVCTASIAGAGEWRAAAAPSGDKKGKDIVRVRGVASKEADTIELEYAMPALKAAKVKAETHLVLGNAPQVGDPGKPVLPVVPCYVVIPQGQVVARVQVVRGKKVDLPGTHVIRHGQKPIPLLPGAKAEKVPPDPAVYGSDDPFPGDTFEHVGVQKKRGASVLVVNLNPVEYRGKSGKVSYYPSIRLKVKTRAALKHEKTQVAYRPDPIRPLSRQVDNPDALKSYETK
jgi:hypothetical protein